MEYVTSREQHLDHDLSKDRQRDKWMDTTVRPKQVIYWPNFVARRRKAEISSTLAITNMVTMRNFEIMSGKFNVNRVSTGGNYAFIINL
jgi:hypothetical protein